jgi:hypothetical protein
MKLSELVKELTSLDKDGYDQFEVWVKVDNKSAKVGVVVIVPNEDGEPIYIELR